MVYGILADAVVLAHAAFVAFVLSGGLLILRWKRLAWLHVPCALWGALVEAAGWVCPLTPLEDWLRSRADEPSFGGGFVERYLLPALYPEHLTRQVQAALGLGVVVLNVSVYGFVIWRRRRRPAR
jgi:hypothetical protein